jgi:glycerol-3-phosphate cytidylyltransferase
MKMNDEDVIGITAGVFDLLHAGHLLMLDYAKQHCDYLIVCVQVDPSMYRAEKQRPTETIFERFVRLEACQYVDRVIPYETEEDLETILNTCQYDIRFIGEDHKGKSFTGDSIRPETFHFNPRSHNYSSTELKERVKKGRKEIKRPEPREAEEPFIVGPVEVDDTRMDGYIKKKLLEERMEGKTDGKKSKATSKRGK